MKYLTLILVLLFAPTASAQLKAGETLEEWPKTYLGFTENDGLQSVPKLFVNLKVKGLSPSKSKVMRPFVAKDLGLKSKKADKPIFAAVSKHFKDKHGWAGVVKSPDKTHTRPEIRFDAVKTGGAVLAAGDTGALVQTSFVNARRLWVDFTIKKDGETKKREFMFFQRSFANKDWTLNFDGFRTMADEKRGIGAEAAFEFFKLLKPSEAKQKLYLAYLMARTFEKVAYPWWESEIYCEKLVGKEAGTSNAFFSHFLKEEVEAVLKRASYLYCFFHKIKTPAKPMVAVEESLLWPEDAKRRLALIEDKEYQGYLHGKNFKLSKLKKTIKAVVAEHREK